MARKPLVNTDALDGLLGNLEQAPSTAQHAKVSELRPLPFQARQYFNEAELELLAQDIAERGVLQPLLVRPADKGYEIVAGERRWRAAKLAGLTEVPVYVRELSDLQAQGAMLMENLQRANLTPLEEVDAKLGLVALSLGLGSQQAAAKEMTRLLREPDEGKMLTLDTLFSTFEESWTSFAKNKLRILNWPAPILEAMRTQGLKRGHAAVIVSAPDKMQARLLKLAAEGASVSELRQELAKGTGESKPNLTPQGVGKVGRKLANSAWVKTLSPDESEALSQWLDQMPVALKAKLGK